MGDVVLEFTVPEPTPSANTWAKAHWSRYYRIREHWFKLLHDTLLENGVRAGAFHSYERAELAIVRFSTHTLDEDNLIGGLKPIIDVLRSPTPSEVVGYQTRLAKNKRAHFHHLGLFLDDTPDRLTLETEQVIVHKRANRRSEFTLSLFA